MEVSGLLYKEKNFNAIGTMSVTDLTQNIISLVTFDCGAKQRTGYWTSYIKGVDKVNKETGTLDNRRDLLSIKITQAETDKVLSEGYGSYLEKITFDDGKQGPIWTIND